jgi:anti-anti-sigma factor
MNDADAVELTVASERATNAGKEYVTIALEGDLDLASVEMFDEEFAAATADPVDAIIVDLTRVRFIDSAGIHSIVRLQESVQPPSRRCRFVITEGTAVDRVLELSGLQERLEPVGDREAAVRALTES